MRIAVDAHAIGQHLTGNEVYVHNLLAGLAAVDRDLDCVVYLSQPDSNRVPSRFSRRQVSVNPFVRLGVDLPRRLQEDRPDLLHVQYTAPLFCPVPVVVSVHDVSFLEHPEYFTPARRFQLRHTVSRTVRRAARVVCPSEFSRRAIQQAYGLDESRLVAVPCAASPTFRPLQRATAQAQVRRELRLPVPFVLTVGDLQPRKNHAALVRAFAALLRENPHLPHHLVLAGQETWHAPAVRRAITESGCAERIHLTGFVSDEHLLQLYNAADLFVFPSLYEGFGIPVLEAMACGRAVACSNAASLPEVADSAALLFRPDSDAELLRAMRDLLVDAELRVRMERLGLQRAALFHWHGTAARTLSVYHEVMEMRSAAPASPPSVPVAPQ